MRGFLSNGEVEDQYMVIILWENPGLCNFINNFLQLKIIAACYLSAKVYSENMWTKEQLVKCIWKWQLIFFNSALISPLKS